MSNCKRSVTEPAKKTLIKDLNSSVPHNSLIWIQGHINKLSLDSNSLFITDGTGSIEIRSLSTNPSSATWITSEHLSKYYMVVGFVQNELSQGSIFIEAMKLTNLSHNPVLEEMWEFEVQHYIMRHNAQKNLTK